ncbi:hypothetical protein [Actinomadura chibensis]|uniref:Uncharacterized protein n=1 Tax=Actinomadura chibensis TaxID=392828 RepID=A0A5D0NIV0_9ACTN|nr:hypothetical protein [Actinomadura chibensis]TYB44298.1 hypothetical protein FXF69_25530 [Actinomadura chibensis]
MRPGESFECVSCDAMVVVIGAATADGVLVCCGMRMRTARPVPCSARLDTASEHGVVAGVRYADPVSGLRVRCTKSGKGPFEFGYRRLVTGATRAPAPPEWAEADISEGAPDVVQESEMAYLERLLH